MPLLQRFGHKSVRYYFYFTDCKNSGLIQPVSQAWVSTRYRMLLWKEHQTEGGRPGADTGSPKPSHINLENFHEPDSSSMCIWVKWLRTPIPIHLINLYQHKLRMLFPHQNVNTSYLMVIGLWGHFYFHILYFSVFSKFSRALIL